MTRGCSLLLALALAPLRASAITCSVANTTPLSFGSYDVFSPAPLHSAGRLRIECQDVAPGDNITVDLSPGDGGRYTPRRMSMPGARDRALRYNLYLDAARTVVWGDGTSGTSHYGAFHPRSGAPLVLPVYGKVFPGQNAERGAYTDTIYVTINY